MENEAIAWAESILGTTVVDAVALPGGVTSTILALTDANGHDSVLRLMTNEPWKSHGSDLTRRERDAQQELAATSVPAPASLGMTSEIGATGVAAHLMSRLPGEPLGEIGDDTVKAMAEMLVTVHDVVPSTPFRSYQSWAWEAKRVVPSWTSHPDSWLRAFDLLAEEPPEFVPTFLHRDYSHRNLLWSEGRITGVVDWVETSAGPAWLDAAHAATNLAVAFGPEPAETFVERYGALNGEPVDRYWFVMDAVGFLPPPGREPLFGSPSELSRLDEWLHLVVSRELG